MPRLISPTMLDSFAYYMSLEDEDASERSRQELLNRLRGVRTPPNAAMQRGIDFEQDVCDAIDYVPIDRWGELTPKHQSIILGIAQELSEATRQAHVGYWLDNETLIHGYVDFLLPKTIVDTKTTASYDWGKDIGNCQHLAYLSALNHLHYRHFKYLVVLFNRDGQALDTVWEDYFYRPQMVDELRGRCAEFLDYLTADTDMGEAYYSRNNAVPGDLIIDG